MYPQNKRKVYYGASLIIHLHNVPHEFNNDSTMILLTTIILFTYLMFKNLHAFIIVALRRPLLPSRDCTQFVRLYFSQRLFLLYLALLSPMMHCNFMRQTFLKCVLSYILFLFMSYPQINVTMFIYVM